MSGKEYASCKVALNDPNIKTTDSCSHEKTTCIIVGGPSVSVCLQGAPTSPQRVYRSLRWKNLSMEPNEKNGTRSS